MARCIPLTGVVWASFALLSARPQAEPLPELESLIRRVQSHLVEHESNSSSKRIEPFCVEWGGASHLMGEDTTVDGLRAFLRALPQLENGRKYDVGTRWQDTATNPVVTPYAPFVLTYSFLPDGTPMPAHEPLESTAPCSIHADLDAAFGGSRVAWKALFAEAFNRWSDFIPVTYIEVPDDGATFFTSPGVLGMRGDIRIGMHRIDPPNSGRNVLGYSFSPASQYPDKRGDLVLAAENAQDFANPTNNYRFLRNLLMHEHGHGIGMFHVEPFNGTKLMESFLTSYFDGPQEDDIRGAQRSYGDRWEANNDAPGAIDLGLLPVAKANGFSTLSLDNLAIEDNGFVDYFKFSIPENSQIRALVDPVGSVYGVRPDPCSCPYEIVVGDGVQDLAFDIIGPDGTTLIASMNESASGEHESMVLCAPGQSFSYHADMNRDLCVNHLDLFGFHFFWRQVLVWGYEDADFDHDGIPETHDLLWLMEERAQSCEPQLPAGVYHLRVYPVTDADDVQRYRLLVGRAGN